MRLAICDDEEKDLSLLRAEIMQCDSTEGVELYSYRRAIDLYDANNELEFDVVILDIEMTAPNGFEIAKKLVEKKRAPIIIFLTNSLAYSIRGYGIAFRYLAKPIDREQLNNALSAAFREANANRFVFSLDGASYIIRMDDIYFFEVFNHFTVLHTMDTSYTFRSTLKDIISQLPAGYFGSPHRSYIVNFTHIKAATSQQLHLTNGVVIPISRGKQQSFEEKLHSYLGR